MNKNLKILIHFLILIGFLIALFLRFYRFGQIPPGLNRDEASIGYTAYSILKTGRDEYGNFLPLSIKSFGDWKLPGYVYSTIPLVALFGLDDWVIRLPSAIAGILTIITVYFLAKELFPHFSPPRCLPSPPKAAGSPPPRRCFLPLLVTLLLALTPWHVYFSRAGYEANLGLLFFTLGALYFIKERFIFSIIWLTLTLYTYHAYHLFTPFFLLVGTLILRKEIKEKRRDFLMAMSLFIFGAGIIFWQNLSANLIKTSGISFMTDPVIIQQQINLPRSAFTNQFWGRLIYNKMTIFTKIFISNYLASFSAIFLVFKGGSHPVHNTPEIGQILLIQYLFFFVGFYYLLKERRNENYLFLLAWILLAPLASSITKDAPSSVRLTPLIIPFNLSAGLGFKFAFDWFKEKSFLLLFYLSTFLLISFNLFFFAQKYFYNLPYERGKNWGAGFKQLAEYLNLPINKDKLVMMEKPHYSPYIYFLFYNQYDPLEYQQKARRYPVTEDGFYHVKEFDRYQFFDLEIEKAILENKISVFRSETINEDQLKIFSPYLKKTIFSESGGPAFYLFEKTR